MIRYFLSFLFTCCLVTEAAAQDLTVATVTRPPFSMVADGEDTGFSTELWHEIASQLGRPYQTVRYDNFSEMLGSIKNGDSDLAIANISITADRLAEMDFSQPIFASGLQIMVHRQAGSGTSFWSAFLSWDLLLAIIGAFALLMTGGMIMWHFEKRSQDYFDKPLRQAIFPSFWWALNLVVNGGFEERMPRSVFGRVFGVLLVVSSLFIVSLFVAHITATMTVEAINGSVRSVNDLYGKRVGTIEGSTAQVFMDARDMRSEGSPDLARLLEKFESNELDAVVFDAPVLAYYVNTSGAGLAELTGSVFKSENYGIALPTNSALREDINRVLLSLREDGTYATIHRKWFGKNP
ncbi:MULTISPECIES: transporter substrate-binding domain-containing protein [Roseobacteraceae]|jgi:polar amino acid transport system substrate-binding protein|uniref:Glutamine-binding periplasmic protein n=1 Tax=Pseudosulfitobacter pseudonitzschiae TaxID=1402135 RepID=A0A221K4V2_9RHOB|nr:MULTISPECIES: transporter substrate-binding domain-containing protein [Roseobacteraceae]ASM74034.1 glutamine-binding periplasmic protein [Pseudosulfitobacter pseudonitzschiae]